MDNELREEMLAYCRSRQFMHTADLFSLEDALRKQRQALIGSDFPLTALICPDGEPDEEGIEWLTDYLTKRAEVFTFCHSLQKRGPEGKKAAKECAEFLHNFFYFSLKQASTEDFFPHGSCDDSLDFLIHAAADLVHAPNIWANGTHQVEFMPDDVVDDFVDWIENDDLYIPLNFYCAVLGAVSVLTGALKDPLEEESEAKED